MTAQVPATAEPGAGARPSPGPRRWWRRASLVAVLTVLLVAVVILSFSVGVPTYSPLLVARVLLTHVTGGPLPVPAVDDTLIWLVRMPRIVAAILIGAALAAAGGAYQSLFRNPMVSPDLLGASGGAGFGAALGILLSWSATAVQFSAFAIGIVAVVLTYVIGTAVGRGTESTLTLVLTGIVVAALFSALISLTKYVADPDDKLPQITFWLLGGLDTVSIRRNLLPLLIPVVVGMAALLLTRWRLNVMTFGDQEAASMGVNPRLIKLVVIAGATLMTSASVSASGMIGWVGLVVPHVARMLAGSDARRALPVSALLGAIFLLVVDDVARSLTTEVPLGILTALVGAPFFLLLLARGRRSWTRQ